MWEVCVQSTIFEVVTPQRSSPLDFNYDTHSLHFQLRLSEIEKKITRTNKQPKNYSKYLELYENGKKELAWSVFKKLCLARGAYNGSSQMACLFLFLLM